MLIDEEVMAVVLAVLVVVGGFSASQTLFAGRIVEPFSKLGVLGPERKIGGYPRKVAVGENFTLYLYVGNHEGRVMYYAVLVKLGDANMSVSDVEPMDAPVMVRFEVVLPHGGNWTRPVTLSIGEPGLNRRLVFELWAYDIGAQGFKYHSRWCQLWLNVTASTIP